MTSGIGKDLSQTMENKTAKEMLLERMIVKFPDKTKEELTKEITVMSWAERMQMYGDLRIDLYKTTEVIRRNVPDGPADNRCMWGLDENRCELQLTV